MKRGLGIYVALTCLICFGALFIAFAQSWTPKLGLDLAGGLSVDYQPVAGQTWNETSLQVAANIMGERASSRGLTNPNITVQGNTIQVQIPGITQPGQALGFLGNTSKLFFRPVLCAAPAYSKETVKGQLVDGPAFNGKTYVCPTVNKFTTAGYVAPQNGASSGGGYSASSFGSDASLAHVQTTSLVDDTYSATVLVPDPSGLYGPRLVLGPALAAGSIVKSAVAQVDPTSGGWVVVASLTGPGITQFDHAATVQYHMLLANDLGAEVNTAPVIEGTDYSNGQVQISGGFTESTANDLAQILNYGSIPIVLKEQQVQYVSATLGKASLQAGLLAGLVGLLLVMAYMIFYYRALGIVVVVGLVTTGALIYGLVCILGHTQNLTLDLAGVTGMIVSVGITVDSYVVYFERLKDEIRQGRTVRASVDRGFKSAFRTVVQADAVSFLGAACLWILSIGAVKGFAFWLGVSTLIDVATAYCFTRPLVIMLGRNRIVTEARGIGIGRGLAAVSEGVA